MLPALTNRVNPATQHVLEMVAAVSDHVKTFCTSQEAAEDTVHLQPVNHL